MHELESEGYLYPVGAKFFKGDTYFLLTDKSKKLLGIDMINNQKIKLAQANKAQLLESCKQCLNCTAWVPELTDWDVMQSGYRDEQIYPELKQFDLTIEQMRQILDNAPDGAQMWRNMDSVCSPNEILYYAWFGGALLVSDDEEKFWQKSIYHAGEEYILDQLEMLSDLQKYVDRYVEQKPKQELEVLEMHDVPCTTVVVEG